MFIIPAFLDKRAYHKQKWRNGKGKNMASKSFEAKENQKEYWGSKLNQRLSFLTGRGFEPGKIAKDTIVRKFRAKMRETESRLKTIALKAKKVEEMARIKLKRRPLLSKKKGKRKKRLGRLLRRVNDSRKKAKNRRVRARSRSAVIDFWYPRLKLAINPSRSSGVVPTLLRVLDSDL